jgi:hypothetical protein
MMKTTRLRKFGSTAITFAGAKPKLDGLLHYVALKLLANAITWCHEKY